MLSPDELELAIKFAMMVCFALGFIGGQQR